MSNEYVCWGQYYLDYPPVLDFQGRSPCNHLVGKSQGPFHTAVGINGTMSKTSEHKTGLS